jgi:hypothetical protein
MRASTVAITFSSSGFNKLKAVPAFPVARSRTAISLEIGEAIQNRSWWSSSTRAHHKDAGGSETR